MLYRNRLGQGEWNFQNSHYRSEKHHLEPGFDNNGDIKRHMKNKLCDPFLWMGFNCSNATESLRGDSLLFTTKWQESPGTHLIDLGRKKG